MKFGWYTQMRLPTTAAAAGVFPAISEKRGSLIEFRDTRLEYYVCSRSQLLFFFLPTRRLEEAVVLRLR